MPETGSPLPPSFSELISTASKPVLVDFWAPWCGPCRIVAPTIQRIARDYTGRLITVKVNVDHRPQVAELWRVEGVPTIMMFWRGEPVMRLMGAYPYESIRREIEKFLPPPVGR